jgi:tetratricopeptide (TPR) repeat protein
VDSLSVEAFNSLPASEKQLRRRLADTWRQRAQQAQSTQDLLRSLRNTVGLAPDNTEDWLQLAALTRTLGAQPTARAYLMEAAGAARLAPQDKRNSLRLRIALQHAWIRYDNGEWRSGLAWTDAARDLNPADRRTLLIRGLTLAGAQRSMDATWIAQEIERQEFFRTDWRWIRGMAAFYQDRMQEATYYLANVRPNPLHRSEFWNDQASMYERIGSLDFARRGYRRAHHSLSLKDKSCLILHERRLPLSDRKTPRMPVWLAFDRFYVAGSLFLYTELALERFEATQQSQEREFWADAVVRAASICIRKNIGEPWTRCWRGKVYAQLELDQLAISDLSRALQGFDRIGWEDPVALYWLGRLRLKQEEYPAARTLLQQSVAIDSTRAEPWSSLGMSMIMTGDMEAGGRALDRALDLDPELAVAWYNRGLLHFHAQRWEESARDLERAAQLAPDNQEIITLLQRAQLLARQR